MKDYDKNKKVKAGNEIELNSTDASSAGLIKGKEYTINDLISSAVIISAGDSVYTLTKIAYNIEKGVDIKELNVGSMAHSVGKVMVNNVLSMDQNDVDTYKKLRDLGVQFDVRKVAADKKADLFKLISEKQNEGLKL